jgi:ketosteroid isomerase-like protein
MAIPKDELSLQIREWYYAASEGQVERFLDFFLKEEETVYFGTDPHELWYGYEQIRQNFEENFKTYGKWSIMSKNLQVFQAGEVAVFTDEVELAARFKESSFAEDARMSGVLIRRDGKWKIIQAHFSLGVPNSELLPG